MLENVSRGGRSARSRSWRADVLRGAALARREARARRAQARELLERLGLARFADARADSLPYGEQRRLEIARALATRPRLLLLDEPAAGMNPSEKEALRELIVPLHREFELTIVLIEHDIPFVMNLCERVTVLDHGEKIAEGPPEAVRGDPQRDRGLPGHATRMHARAPSTPLLRVDVARGRLRRDPRAARRRLRGARGRDRDADRRERRGQVDAAARGERAARGRARAGSGSTAPTSPRERADRRVARGISQVPEGRRIFANLTVRENLEMGAYLRDRARRERVRARARAVPAPRASGSRQSAGTLSGGEQQMLAIGRALMAQPRLLLLDEPSLGLAPLLVQQIFAIIREINAQGTTVLLVEQNARQALRVAQRAYVLETGELSLEGSAASLASDPRVREAYLGEGDGPKASRGRSATKQLTRPEGRVSCLVADRPRSVPAHRHAVGVRETLEHHLGRQRLAAFGEADAPHLSVGAGLGGEAAREVEVGVVARCRRGRRRHPAVYPSRRAAGSGPDRGSAARRRRRA